MEIEETTPATTAPVITVELLAAKGACSDGRSGFIRAVGGHSAVVTVEAAEALASDESIQVPWEWAAQKLLSAEGYWRWEALVESDEAWRTATEEQQRRYDAWVTIRGGTDADAWDTAQKSYQEAADAQWLAARRAQARTWAQLYIAEQAGQPHPAEALLAPIEATQAPRDWAQVTSDPIGDDVIDTRDILAYMEWLESDHLTADGMLLHPGGWDDQDEAADWRVWRDALDEIAENAGDRPRDGVQLICDSGFEDYARDLADDMGVEIRDEWPYRYIDWEAAADELRTDYNEIIIGSYAYLYR